MTIEDIAKTAHEVNRAYCSATGDDTQKSWEEADQWQRDSAIKGVQFAIDNPDLTPADQHDAWTADKIANGWRYGTVKDADAKRHPCLVSYDALPEFQRTKDYLFRAVVKSLVPLIG
ncbi:MAG TPA: RyR domain-containing protein [Bryobacteraceae bacterium]|nr:RyR domain-containing protein [Bryobacteraceae bacterium]